MHFGGVAKRKRCSNSQKYKSLWCVLVLPPLTVLTEIYPACSWEFITHRIKRYMSAITLIFSFDRYSNKSINL